MPCQRPLTSFDRRSWCEEGAAVLADGRGGRGSGRKTVEAGFLRAVFALLVEYLEVDPVVLRHDEAMSRKAFPRLSHQDDPQEIDVDDVGDLAVDAHAPARQLLPGHGVTWVAQVVDTQSGPESVTSIAVFMSHLLFDEHVIAWLRDRRVALPCHYRPITAKGA